MDGLSCDGSALLLLRKRGNAKIGTRLIAIATVTTKPANAHVVGHGTLFGIVRGKNVPVPMVEEFHEVQRALL